MCLKKKLAWLNYYMKKREFIHFLCETKKKRQSLISKNLLVLVGKEMTELGVIMKSSTGLLCTIVDS